MMRKHKDFAYGDLAKAVEDAIRSALVKEEAPKFQKTTRVSKNAMAVLEVLDAEDEPQGKSYIILHSGIDANDWTETITELKESNLVIQTGAKRGTKYTNA
jgi:predicted transcriptional regulator